MQHKLKKKQTSLEDTGESKSPAESIAELTEEFSVPILCICLKSTDKCEWILSEMSEIFNQSNIGSDERGAVKEM